LAIPAISTNLIKSVQNTLIIIVVGRVGNAETMAAIGLGNMTKLMLGTTILQGLNGGIETFVSQAVGAG